MPGVGVGGGGGGIPADFELGNTAIYLYQRTVEQTPVPERPSEVSYDLTDLDNTSLVANRGWSGEIPSESEGSILWVTFGYISAASGTVMNANSWDTPQILSIAGEAGEAGVSVWIETSDGTIFRNNAGPSKTLTANVSVGEGVPSPTEYAGFTYRWLFGEDTVYVDSGRNLLTLNGVPITTAGAGRFAADSTVTTTVGDLRSIFVDNTDVTTQLRLAVEVGSI